MSLGFSNADENQAPVEIASIQVFPVIAHTFYGGEVQFTAYAYDAAENQLDIDLTGCWSASAGIIDDDGRYIANIVGYHTVTCRYEVGSGDNATASVAGTASVHVSDPRPR